LRKSAAEADAKLKRLCDAIENGIADLSDSHETLWRRRNGVAQRTGWSAGNLAWNPASCPDAHQWVGGVTMNWRNTLLDHFAPNVSKLTLVADPDALLTEERLAVELCQRGFEEGSRPPVKV
jgi:hypothetical protein